MHTLFLSFALLFQVHGDCIAARKVLMETQATILDTRTLSYHSEYRQVYSAMDDSLTVVAGFNGTRSRQTLTVSDNSTGKP